MTNDRLPLALAHPDDGGVPLADEIVRRVGNDDAARKILTFIADWGTTPSEPTIREVAESSVLPLRTAYRRLEAFREAFPSERTPSRVYRLTLAAAHDDRLWDNDIDRALWHSIGEVPVIAQDGE